MSVTASMSMTTWRTGWSAPVTARLTAEVNTAPFAKNSGAAIRTTTRPGRGRGAGGGILQQGLLRVVVRLEHVDRGFAARLARLMSASTNATRMPGIAPTNSVTRKQVAPTANSNRS